jgi:uncharacterized protein (DUF1501 family)
LPLDDNFGFNPHMKELHAFYQKGLCVPILNVGSPHATMKSIGTAWLNRMLADVSGTLGAFVDDLGHKGMDNVFVLDKSEFGRSAHENCNRGTDHGHGGFMLAVGGKLVGHKVDGKWTGLEDSKLYEKRDLPVMTDFRVVFAETLKGLFGFDGIKERLFPQYSPDFPPLGFLRTA